MIKNVCKFFRRVGHALRNAGGILDAIIQQISMAVGPANGIRRTRKIVPCGIVAMKCSGEDVPRRADRKQAQDSRFAILCGSVHIAVIAVSLFLNVNVLSAQNWQKKTSTDRWGDVTGYSYLQEVTGSAHGNKTVSMSIGFGWNAEQSQALMMVCKPTNELTWNPAYSFMSEKISFSVRKEGVTKEFMGFTVSDASNWQSVSMVILDEELITLLRGSGQWDVLIEGENWYIRTTIKGSLPKE